MYHNMQMYPTSSSHSGILITTHGNDNNNCNKTTTTTQTQQQTDNKNRVNHHHHHSHHYNHNRNHTHNKKNSQTQSSNNDLKIYVQNNNNNNNNYYKNSSIELMQKSSTSSTTTPIGSTENITTNIKKLTTLKSDENNKKKIMGMNNNNYQKTSSATTKNTTTLSPSTIIDECFVGNNNNNNDGDNNKNITLGTYSLDFLHYVGVQMTTGRNIETDLSDNLQDDGPNNKKRIQHKNHQQQIFDDKPNDIQYNVYVDDNNTRTSNAVTNYNKYNNNNHNYHHKNNNNNNYHNYNRNYQNGSGNNNNHQIGTINGRNGKKNNWDNNSYQKVANMNNNNIEKIPNKNQKQNHNQNRGGGINQAYRKNYQHQKYLTFIRSTQEQQQQLQQHQETRMNSRSPTPSPKSESPSIETNQNNLINGEQQQNFNQNNYDSDSSSSINTTSSSTTRSHHNHNHHHQHYHNFDLFFGNPTNLQLIDVPMNLRSINEEQLSSTTSPTSLSLLNNIGFNYNYYGSHQNLTSWGTTTPPPPNQHHHHNQNNNHHHQQHNQHHHFSGRTSASQHENGIGVYHSSSEDIGMHMNNKKRVSPISFKNFRPTRKTGNNNFQNKSGNMWMHNLNENSFIHTPSDHFLAKSYLVETKYTPKNLIIGSEWDTLSQSIWERFKEAQQTEETYKKKMFLWRYLYINIKKVFPNYGLYLVGSTLSGFGTNTSDVDMCLVSRFVSNIDPRLEAIINLTELKNYLLNTTEIFVDFNLIQAKVPILRFTDSYNSLEIDLNFNNSVGVRNTHLLYCYLQMDWRLKPLAVVVKLWAQYHHINNAKNMTISSYSLELMVIHFLQCGCNPEILPCLHKLYPDKFQKQNDINSIDMREEMKPYHSKNKQTIGELFFNFLEYYSNFDYSQHAISVRTASLLPIEECRQARSLKNDAHQWKQLCIEEPFDLTNTARSVYDGEIFERIKMVFVTSWKILKETMDMNSLFSTIFLSSVVQVSPPTPTHTPSPSPPLLKPTNNTL